MYEPILNHVLVEIDDREAKWGGDDSSDSPLGKSYKKGTLRKLGDFFVTKDYPFLPNISMLSSIVNRPIMWHAGHEGESIFEHEGKKYAFIFWWDIVGVKVAADATDQSLATQHALPEEQPEQPIYKPDPAENEDVKKTRATLKKHGVQNPEGVDIIGGGAENGHFTGIR